MTRSRGFSSPGGSGPGRRSAVALGVVAAMAIGAAACGSSSSGGLSASSAASSLAAADNSPTAAGGLHLPAQLLGLNKNTSRTGKQLAGAFKSEFSVLSSILRSPQVAFYGTDSSPDVFVFAARWTRPGQMASAGVEKRLATALAVNGGAGARSFPAGPDGGALVCGHKASGVKGFICVWANKLTMGGAGYVYGAASSLSDAASKTKQVQSAIGA